jgi:transcriptional regulator with XRE-family HTH domain
MEMAGTLDNRASITLALGLEAALAASSMTKQQLAHKARCSPGHVTEIEKRIKNPSPALVSRIAAALGMKPVDLYELGEQKLDEQAVEIAWQTRRRMERLRTRQVVLEVLPDLGARDLRAIVSAASALLDRPVE